MKSYDESDKYDREHLAKLNAEPWQVELLALNPDYTGWAPGDDYMGPRGDGWNAPVTVAKWSDLSFGPNDLNEVVNFYFEVNRESRRCECGDGYRPDAQWIAKSFYRHSNPFCGGRRPAFGVLAKYGDEFRRFCAKSAELPCSEWASDVTQDEVQALVDEGRLMDFTHTCSPGEGWKKRAPPVVPTAAEVNAWNRRGSLGHDAINRCLLIRARCKRLGVPLHCPTCNGEASVYTAPAAHVGLVLWVLHPRKGASRGVEIERIEQSELPAVFAYLKAASERNAERFARAVALCNLAVAP